MHTEAIVLGTAGHIDHGKTALVRALTGIDTDRLKVEKERGITTELGFAYLDIGERRFGFVDVPGHERFIKSMVSGATGLDLVVLVIAADEGVMPQTREHLDICELLGVRHGVVALTKVDLVDDEWRALVVEDVRGSLAGTFVEDAPLIPVSVKTGEGLDALRAAFATLTAALPARPAAGVFRLPIDRVFTIKGFGTVVTGTIQSGSARTGDACVLHPGERKVKIRGLQLHGEAADEARAGMRCAVNLHGVDRDEVIRGDVLGHPGAFEPSHLIDATFRYLGTSRGPLGRRTRVLLHHGTTQSLATLVLVGADKLLPGDRGLVQLRLDVASPLAALPGDRFIARGFVVQEHYGTTIGGGEIVRVHAPKVRRSSEEAAEAVRRVAAAAHDERVALEVRGGGPAGMDRGALLQRLGMAPAVLDAALARLEEQRELVLARGDGGATLYCHAEPFAILEQTAVRLVEDDHQRHPNRAGMSREELRARLPRAMPPRLFEHVLGALVARDALVVDQDVVRRPRHQSSGPSAEQQAVDARVGAQFAAWGTAPARPAEVAAAVGLAVKETRAALDRLLAGGALIKVKADLYVHGDVIDDLRRRLVAHLDEHGAITPAQWKEITGATRKYAIPLAEHFDGEKLTLRVGEVRKRRG